MLREPQHDIPNTTRFTNCYAENFILNLSITNIFTNDTDLF